MPCISIVPCMPRNLMGSTYTVLHNALVGHQGLISFLEPSAMLALQPSTTHQALNDWCELCTLCSFSGTEWLTWKVAEKKPNRKVKSCVPSAESPWGRAVTQRGALPPQHPLQGQAAESLWCSPAPGGRDMGAHPLCQDRHAVQQP